MRAQSATIYTPVSDVATKNNCFWRVTFRVIIFLIIIGPFLYAAVRYMNAPQNINRSMGYIQIPISSLPEGKSQLILYHGQPVIVINSHGNIKALSALCTINDSILRWDDEREELVCTVHGSRFDLNGNVKSGLAPRPLDRFKVMRGEDTLIIGGIL